jgi:hypothetical protein
MLNWLIPASRSAAARLDGEHPAMGDQRDVLEANRAVDGRDEILEIATQQRLATRERDEHRVEVARLRRRTS